MTTQINQGSTENARLVEVDASHWYDSVLRHTPLRTIDLAAAPGGSDLKPIRGDRGIPFIGLGLHTVLYGPAFQIQLMRRHGPVSWWQAFGRRIVAVSGPEAVQEVLADKDKAFVSGWPDVIGPWFDGGLLAMDGPEHRRDRRFMRPAYGTSEITGYAAKMAEDADEFLARWPIGQRFEAVPAIRELSGQITTRAFLGVPYDPVGRRIMWAVEECIRAETSLVRLRIPGTPWHKAHNARRWLTDYLTSELPAARARESDDFISVFARINGPDGAAMSASQIVDHMIFTLIASHDTTTSATIAAFYFLGKHPQWQSRARAEALSGATSDDPNSLDTLDLVIRESVRLVPPSPIALRTTTKDTAVLGHFIPAGQLVSVCTGVNQLVPELWPQAGRFDPDRFSAERREDRVHRFAWAPFGGGAHKCIGMQLGLMKVKATLNVLLRRFAWTFPDSYEAPWRFTSLPAPTDGLPVVLRSSEPNTLGK